MVRNRYDQIPNPTQDTKRERNTNTKECIKNKTTQLEKATEEESSFPVDGHKSI